MKTYHELHSNTSTNVRIKGLKTQLKQAAISNMALLFPKTTKSYIRRLFFKPVRRKYSHQQQGWLNKARNFQISVNHKTIQCWQWGEGPQIFTAHGWNELGVNLYPLFSPLLKKGFSVTAFDAPAHGTSEGEQTNYFEITDTLRTLINSRVKNQPAGIIGHSIGGAAVINCLAKENFSTKTVLIAPALQLNDILRQAFRQKGIPKSLFESIITDIETEFGANLKKENPYTLLENLKSEIMLAHDVNDRLIPFTDASTIARQHNNIMLHTTKGLGHRRIMTSQSTADTVVQYFT